MKEAKALVESLKNDKALLTQRIMNLERREPDSNIPNEKIKKVVKGHQIQEDHQTMAGEEDDFIMAAAASL